jgi:hypothetical protein
LRGLRGSLNKQYLILKKGEKRRRPKTPKNRHKKDNALIDNLESEDLAEAQSTKYNTAYVVSV